MQDSLGVHIPSRVDCLRGREDRDGATRLSDSSLSPNTLTIPHIIQVWSDLENGGLAMLGFQAFLADNGICPIKPIALSSDYDWNPFLPLAVRSLP